jgi:transposase
MSEPCVATTAKGAPCKRQAVLGTDRCPGHLGINGRKSTINDATTRQLAQLLRAGNYVEVAVQAAGVKLSTFWDWWARGNPEHDDPADKTYRKFRAVLERARAEGEARNVTLVAQAASETWQAAAWMLERSYPERWGRPSQRTAIEVVPEPAKPDDPFREVDDLAEARRARADAAT